jgi:nitrite reductase/ring-hydroxylating ferredoxin subunit
MKPRSCPHCKCEVPITNLKFDEEGNVICRCGKMIFSIQGSISLSQDFRQPAYKYKSNFEHWKVDV